MMCFGVKDRKRVNANHCVIVLLDDTQLVHELHASSTGQDLLDVAIKHLNLLETSYFGLKYLDEKALNHDELTTRGGDERGLNGVNQLWLDMEKSALKQLRFVQPMTVYFGVKYYAADPCKLAEEITRYQFFLQCKQDILHSRLPVTFELAIELFALSVQSELGDYDPERQDDGDYVSEFQFLPNQSLELEKRVASFHRTLVGQVPATAELNFLERVKWLDLYGCELHPIQYEEDSTCDDYALGLNPGGVLVLRNKLKVAQYVWPRILKTKCQGRCLLMDVIESSGGGGGGNGKENGERSSRFGFRLLNKAASRRLHHAIEEHKSFHHLIHSSATLQQLAERQHQQLQFQQMKLSQRFRQSIRSAINVGPFANHAGNSKKPTFSVTGGPKLRSSVKSLANQQLQMMQHYALDGRAPPAVVRTPSRRYGSAKNRSLKLTCPTLGPEFVAVQGNNIGLPHTLSESQRQQALMLMSNLVHGGTAGKSQTLKPVPSSAKHNDSKSNQKNNPYYHMMMMMMAAQAQQQQQQPAMGLDVPHPGERHLAQLSLYKQVAAASRSALADEQLAIHQLYNSKAQHLPGSSMYPKTGRESPKSTKSAQLNGGTLSSSSSAVRLANKKVVHTRQPLHPDGSGINHQHQIRSHDLQSLLVPLDTRPRQKAAMPNEYYEVYRSNESNSTNVSPRSSRSTRIAGKHKSKSTIENLNLLHVRGGSSTRRYTGIQPMLKNSNSNKMLLATTTPLQLQKPPPPSPGYSANHTLNHNTNSSLKRQISGINTNIKRPQGNTHSTVKDMNNNNYCCLRSDCSSDEGVTNQAPIKSINGLNKSISNRKRRVQAPQGAIENNFQAQTNNTDEMKEWNAIRKRHSEFLLHGSFGAQMQPPQVESNLANQSFCSEDCNVQKVQNNNNNNSNTAKQQQHLIKNISNKQATPILLSMNYEQNNSNNNRAIQLLNLQRQQLNSQTSVGSKSSSSIMNSASSSLASSPQASNGSGQQQRSHNKQNELKIAGSTASSSSTSGYYAGSNSISESASAESDSQITTIEGESRTFTSRQQVPSKDWSNRVQLDLESRSKIGNSYNMMGGNHLDTHNQDYMRSSLLDSQQLDPQNRNIGYRQHKQQQFYLGEATNQMQQAPSKYVSFDV